MKEVLDCECGASNEVDADILTPVKCPACGKEYVLHAEFWFEPKED